MSLEERANRILTTHVGSLPRPDALSAMMADGKTGTPVFDKAVTEAVDGVVRRQAEVGIDIVDDGEQSKPGFVAYVFDRIGGFSPREDMPDGFLKTRENQAFPEFYSGGHSGAALPRVATKTAIKYTGHR
jgi:5-methyltetrahydropteroyltriglutamate--homocysteine methyltransferase